MKHPFLRVLLAVVILVIGTVPLLMTLRDTTHFDVELYQKVGSDIANGVLPYRDRVLEYPPYAIPYFLIPNAFGAEDYAKGFKLLALLTDGVIKALLLWVGWKEAKGLRALLPLAVYCAGIPFLSYFFLQRYDLFPSFLSLAALLLFCAKKETLAGMLLVFGMGAKLYPALFIPPLFFFALREGRWKPFVAGLALGAAPLAALGAFLPWWDFLAYHNERGLQGESFFASLIWLAHFPGWIAAQWLDGHGCMEVRGAVADAVLPWARAVFAGVVLTSTVAACRAAWRSQESSAPDVARVLLVPLLGFMAFNQVFSPQFLIWILPIAGVAALDRRHTKTALVVVLIVVATALTRLFFPTNGYNRGLTLFETQALVLRNLVLIAAWTFSIYSAFKIRRHP